SYSVDELSQVKISNDPILLDIKVVPPPTTNSLPKISVSANFIGSVISELAQTQSRITIILGDIPRFEVSVTNRRTTITETTYFDKSWKIDKIFANRRRNLFNDGITTILQIQANQSNISH